MLTVLTWLWAQPGGRATYTAEHVNIWRAMVARHLTIPHRFACVTDMPDGIDPRVEIIAPPGDFLDVRLPTWKGDKPQCLRRIALFRPDAADIFGERFVSMDLDCVVAQSLDPLFSRSDDFLMFRGTSAARPYNGSLVLMTAGSRPQVFERFTPREAFEAGRRYVGSDQAWISHVLGWGEATVGEDEGVFWWRRGAQNLDGARLMFFPGDPKPWSLAATGDDAFVSGHYRGEDRGRCLFLGYGPDVWRDVAQAGDYEAVIATREAAAVWPGQVLDYAEDAEHAARMARLHGFSDLVVCGPEVCASEVAA